MAERHHVPAESARTGERRHLDRRGGGAPGLDPLTGLADRAGLVAAAHGPVWLVLVDLDRFRLVNDGGGHAAGDRVLCDVALVLDEVASPFDGVVARLSADEFAIALPGDQDVDRLVAAVIDGLGTVGCSVGVTHGDASLGVERLLVEADVALRRSKRLGGGRAVHFDESARDALGRLVAGTLGEVVEVGVQLQRSLVDRTITGAMVVPEVAGLRGVDLCLLGEVSGRRFGLLDATLDGIARSGRPIPPAGLRIWFGVEAADVIGHAEELRSRLSSAGLSGTPFGVELAAAGAVDRMGLAESIDTLRAHGVQVALPVTGPSPVGFADLTRLRPDRIVVDPDVVDAVRSGDDALGDAVRAMVGVSVAVSAEVVAVDVPSLDRAALLADLGVGVAQVEQVEPWAPARARVRA